MPDEEVSISKNEEQPLSLRTQKLISYLEDLWKRPYTPSPETLMRITNFLSQFPEPYQTLGLTKIAEHLTTSLSLHFLDIMATFQQKAGDEGFSREEQKETLLGVLSERFPEMMGISKQILVRSIDDLVTLSNIILSLYMLSQVETAEKAQGRMYELPAMYWHQLAQERLITNMQLQVNATKTTMNMQLQMNVTMTNTNKILNAFTSLVTTLPNSVEILPPTVEVPTN